MLVIRLAIALMAVVAAARALRPLCRIAGQPPVVADMAAGILLGPSFLGWVAPAVTAWLFAPAALGPLAQVAQVGVVLYMFVVGAELDFDRARTQARSTAWIALAGIVVPVALGALLATRLDQRLLPDGLPLWQAALFLGMAMAMTAFPVLARILADTGIMASPLGSRALSCAAVADLIVWATVGLMVGTFEQRSSAWMAPVSAATFVVGMLVVVRPAVIRAATSPVAEGALGLPLALAGVLAVAFVAEAAGVHAIVGAFLLGVGLPPGSVLAKALRARLGTVLGIVLPAFFAVAGLRTEIGLIHGMNGWLTCAAIIMVATTGKLGATAVAARLSGTGWWDATRLGVLMNVRGLMELLVLNVGLDLGLVSREVYTMMVLMALATTVMAVPVLALMAVPASALMRKGGAS